MIRLKAGASVDNTRPILWWAVAIVGEIYDAHQIDLVLTSIRDGEHMQGSRHDTGEAFDCRTHSIPSDLKRPMWAEIREVLGRDWDVLFEYEGLPREHFHVEHNPKPLPQSVPA